MFNPCNLGQKRRTEENPQTQTHNNHNQNKVDRIKAAGMNYFVKEDRFSVAVQSYQISTTTTTTSAADTKDTPEFCSTCRVSLTSPLQAQAHYTGSKHRLKLELQNEMESKYGHGSSQSSNLYCETCQIKATSQSQLEMHYNGYKHKQKCKLLQDMNIPSVDPTVSQIKKVCRPEVPPVVDAHQGYGMFCNVCQLNFNSTSQAQAHYQGSKHLSRLRVLEDMNIPSVETTVSQIKKVCRPEVPPVVDAHQGYGMFCNVCQLNFNSTSQAQAHYQGSKHLSRLRVLEEKNSLACSSSSLYQTDDGSGEPAAKKAKFVEICETCNVKLLCPAAATAHYNGVKHAKSILQTKGAGDQTSLNMTPYNSSDAPAYNNQTAGQGRMHNSYNPSHPIIQHRMPPEAQRRAVTALKHPMMPRDVAPEVKKGGHLYCAFCEIHMNSQTQMDAHRAGLKHKERVEKIANLSSKPATVTGTPTPSVTTLKVMPPIVTSACSMSAPPHHSSFPDSIPPFLPPSVSTIR